MRRLLVLAAAMAIAVAAPVAVSAAAPANDLPDQAISLGTALPQTIVQDTSEATVSTDDVGCGAGGTDQATVWYSFSPAASGDFVIDASASSYFVGINVFAGTPTVSSIISCFGTAGVVSLTSGTTYYIMFADADGDATNGGTLRATLDVAPPPITVSLTLNSSGKLAKGGLVTVGGTITCSSAADSSEVDVSVSQNVGRFTIHGFGFTDQACGPSPTPWSAVVSGDNGTFSGTKVSVSASAFACNAFSCGDASISGTVRLRK